MCYFVGETNISRTRTLHEMTDIQHVFFCLLAPHCTIHAALVPHSLPFQFDSRWIVRGGCGNHINGVTRHMTRTVGRTSADVTVMCRKRRQEEVGANISRHSSFCLPSEFYRMVSHTTESHES